MTIKAECHSDDRAVECNFDATAWFEQADLVDIVNVSTEDWAFGYATDNIAIFEADRNEEVAFMFKYIEVRGRIESMGFGCSVDEKDAKAWLKENRPDALAEIEEQEDDA